MKSRRADSLQRQGRDTREQNIQADVFVLFLVAGCYYIFYYLYFTDGHVLLLQLYEMELNGLGIYRV